MRTLSKLAIVGLAGCGGYLLWQRYGGRLASRRARHTAGDRRVSGRAGLSADESAVGSDDPVAQAAAILSDSDDRSRLSRDAPGIEHRHSEDTVAP
jgi:hypothetical protein